MQGTEHKPSFAFVTPTLSGGGAERVVSVLSSELARMGYVVHILVHKRKEGEYPVDPKVDVYYDPHHSGGERGLIPSIRKLLRVRRIIRSWKPDFVIPFMDFTMVHTWWATRFLPVRFVATIRNNPKERPKKFKRFADFVIGRSDALYAQTQAQKEYFPRAVQEKTFVLPNPVNPKMLEQEHTYAPEPGNLIAVGRLNAQKNYPMMIDAIRLLKGDFPELRLRIFGVGEKKDAPQKKIDASGLSGSITLEGRSDEMEKRLNESDIFLMTSDFEGMPNALMEAMAVGLPCVSTDCPSGPADLITSGENGLLAPVGDAEAFARQLRRLLENPQLCVQMGMLARQTIREGYTPDQIARRLVAACESIRNRENKNG